MNTHLPLGVFLNDKSTAPMSIKTENPATPGTNEELLPLTPLSNCNVSINEESPGSVEMEMVGSSVAQSLEMIIDTP